MIDFSEKSIRENCPHCDPNSFAFKHPLEKTANFSVVCDVHPLVEGHILIIPKNHLSCVGEYSNMLFEEFTGIYQNLSQFFKTTYGSVSTFEHGKFGQNVFHSHIHLLPYNGKVENIIPEGKGRLRPLKNLKGLKKIYQKEEGYLFFSIENMLWTVDPVLSQPRFFRDRFAKALGNPERGNWKEMYFDKQTMKKANQEIRNLETVWQKEIHQI